MPIPPTGNPTRPLKITLLVVSLLLAGGLIVPVALLLNRSIYIESFIEVVKTVGTIFAPILAAVLGYYFNARQSAPREEYERRIDEIEAKSEQHPERARFAWDIASIKLEAYFNRNLAQVNLIFWISVGVMAVGFGFILFGISRSLAKPDVITPSYIAATAGIITELIGATFMLIYRSTMKQAGTYMATLERINSVGMAVQILDSISAEDVELKNSTKSELVKLLLDAQVATRTGPAESAKPATRKARAAPSTGA